MDAIVQFVRNALCTAKNFNILGDTFLYDPKVTAQYYAFPPPLDQTTPLEIFISITQFYAFVAITLSGYKIITSSGVGKLQLITRLVNLRSTSKEEEKKKKDGDKDDDKSSDAASSSAARRLVNQSLLDESDQASRSFFVGVNVLVLGLAFFWLFANSFHVTDTDWIGGLWGLIYALIVMEIALVVFLYYMVKDAGSSVRKSKRMEEFAKKMESKSKGLTPEDVGSITVEEYGWLVDGWSPFWADGAGDNATILSAEGKMLTKEEEAVASRIDALSKKVGSDVPDKIREGARTALFEGYREYVYLVLNLLAFYGYFACIVTEYYPDEATKPEYVHAILGWMTNADAGWLGNAVGDFAWTVEPIVILSSPMLAGYMSPGEKKKEKSE